MYREPIVSALTDCSRLLASLGLTDKDGVRILGSAKALVDTIGRLLVLVKQDENVSISHLYYMIWLFMCVYALNHSASRLYTVPLLPVRFIN